MSEGSGKNEMANALGGLAAVVIVMVFIAMFIAHVVTWIWLNLMAPLFVGVVFYALPWALGSAVWGLGWSALAHAVESERGGDYRLLAVLIPACGIFIWMTVGFPVETPWVKEVVSTSPHSATKTHHTKKRKPLPLPPLMAAINPLPGDSPTLSDEADAPKPVDPVLASKPHFAPLWPELSDAYARFVGNLGLPRPRLTNRESTPYDQATFALILWSALFLGAPAVFWAAAIQDRSAFDAQWALQKKSREEIESGKRAEIRSQYQHEVYTLQEQLKEKNEELSKLQTSQQFVAEQSAVPVPDSLGAPKLVHGVMDTDVL